MPETGNIYVDIENFNIDVTIKNIKHRCITALQIWNLQLFGQYVQWGCHFAVVNINHCPMTAENAGFFKRTLNWVQCLCHLTIIGIFHLDVDIEIVNMDLDILE